MRRYLFVCLSLDFANYWTDLTELLYTLADILKSNISNSAVFDFFTVSR